MGIPIDPRPVTDVTALVPPEPVAGVDLGPVLRLEAPGRCPVCSETVLERAVSCPGCLTDHHEECVQFNGACGVFGCGCGAPEEMALIPEPIGGQALLYSRPVTFLRTSPMSYVTLAGGSMLAMMVALDPRILWFSMGVPASYFVIAGSVVGWICHLLLENIERSC